MPFGSSVAFSERINESATGSFTRGSHSRLAMPMPCAAEIEPPCFGKVGRNERAGAEALALYLYERDAHAG